MSNMKTLTINGAQFTVLDAVKPLILDANMTSTYDNDSQYGDEALAAILAGRQILVKTPNASGNNYIANLSPVYMYQVPVNSDYLYLFYIRDEKQVIDLSVATPELGEVSLPIHGQLQMKLSQTYTECPLK